MVAISGWSDATPEVRDERAEAIGVAFVSDGDTTAASNRTFFVKDIGWSQVRFNLK